MVLVAGGVFWPTPRGEHHPLVILSVHLAMLQTWTPSHLTDLVNAYNGPSWSIATEYAFYLLFIPLIHNWSRTWWWKLPLTLAVPVGVVVAVHLTGWTLSRPTGLPGYEQVLYFHPLARVGQFALGMAASLLWRRLCPRLNVGRVLGTGLELATAALFAASVYYSHPVALWAWKIPELGHPVAYLLHSCSMTVAGPAAALIFVLANEWGYVSRLLTVRPLVRLGDISYGVYVLHLPLLHFVANNQMAVACLPGWQISAVYWAVLLILSHWTHVVIEQPARKWIVGLWPKTAPSEGSGRGTVFALVRSPSARLIGETLVLVAAVLAVGAYVARSHFRFVNPDKAEQFVKYAPGSTRDVRFGDAYLLRGATLHEAAGGVQLRLVWQTLKSQPPQFHMWVQGINPPPAEECVWAVVEMSDLGFGVQSIPPGLVWEQRVFLSQDKLSSAAQIVVLIWNKDGTQFLPSSGGPHDDHGRLRLFPAERTPAALTVAGK